MILSGYRAVWIFAMFDLPTDTKKARKDYTDFRKNLLKNGFTMLQIFGVCQALCKRGKCRCSLQQG